MNACCTPSWVNGDLIANCSIQVSNSCAVSAAIASASAADISDLVCVSVMGIVFEVVAPIFASEAFNSSSLNWLSAIVAAWVLTAKPSSPQRAINCRWRSDSSCILAAIVSRLSVSLVISSAVAPIIVISL